MTRLEHAVAEALAQRLQRLARVVRAQVGDVHHDAEPVEALVQVLARQLASPRAPARRPGARSTRPPRRPAHGRGDERVDGQQPERRRAVDQDQLVLRRDSCSARFSVSSRPIFPLSTSSASASPRFAGIMFLWIASDAAAARRAPRRSSARRPAVDVEVVGEVALRIEVDREHVEARRGGRRRQACGPSSSCPCRPSATGPRSWGWGRQNRRHRCRRRLGSRVALGTIFAPVHEPVARPLGEGAEPGRRS